MTLEQAKLGQPEYQPSDEVKERLSTTTMVAMVGATAVGKNFLLKQSGLPIVRSLTTRAPRPDDDPSLYQYIDQKDMLERVAEQRLVQYAVYGEIIHATAPESYDLGTVNAKDIYWNAVKQLEDKGFKSVKSISVLTPKEQWTRQLMERFDGISRGEIHDRLAEARHSLRWTRMQVVSGALRHLVVVNTPGNLSENLETIDNFLGDQPHTYPNVDEVLWRVADMERTISMAQMRLVA